ncbi:MAG: alpha-beta hydrolase superfamily lysophospholipase [Saprospiraceae bacterium]|jgi:alpha-beta hydrolase superfamily lysophospholipase
MKTFKRVLLVLFCLYVIVCMGLYFIQDSIIFDAHLLDEDHRFRSGEELKIPVANNISLSTYHLPIDNPKGVILYFHGNRGNIRRCIRQIERFAPEGYELYMPDYRGYGKSDGLISNEKDFLQDAQKIYDYIKSRHPENQISIVGYSLGTGPATYISANNTPQELILVAPFISFVDLKNRWSSLIPNFLLKYKLNNRKHILESTCPITILHGTEDEVIPYDSSESLEALDPERIDLITLQGEGHRGAIFNGNIRTSIIQ